MNKKELELENKRLLDQTGNLNRELKEKEFDFTIEKENKNRYRETIKRLSLEKRTLQGVISGLETALEIVSGKNV